MQRQESILGHEIERAEDVRQPEPAVVKAGVVVEVGEVGAGAATSSVVSPSVDHSSARQSTTTGLSLRTQSAVHEDVDVPRLTTR